MRDQWKIRAEMFQLFVGHTCCEIAENAISYKDKHEAYAPVSARNPSLTGVRLYPNLSG